MKISIIGLAFLAGCSPLAQDAGTNIFLADGKDACRAVVCHRPYDPADPKGVALPLTLEVSCAAVEAHLRHGDTLGECPEDTGGPDDTGLDDTGHSDDTGLDDTGDPDDTGDTGDTGDTDCDDTGIDTGDDTGDDDTGDSGADDTGNDSGVDTGDSGTVDTSDSAEDTGKNSLPVETKWVQSGGGCHAVPINKNNSMAMGVATLLLFISRRKS